MSKVIGIDLGTTNSCVAIWEGNQPRILSNFNGDRTMPSVVAFTASGERLVGMPARNQQITNPTATIYSIKRFMGRRHNEVRGEEKIVPYEIVGNGHEFVKVKVKRRRCTPQEISAMILRELKAMAEDYLGESVSRAVITVPAYFNDSQRQATKDAGEIAGLTVERIINEPTAAALAYGLEQRVNKKIIVFDFGGGTFDLSAMEIGNNFFKVYAVHGNTHLGGDDFDQRIIDVVADDFRRKERIDIRQESMALQRLKEAAEQAKTELSFREETTIMLPFICVDGSGPKHIQYTMERERFESVCADLFDDLGDCCKKLMHDVGWSSLDIEDVVMVGGSTRIPKVQEIAMEVFQTLELDKSINPDEVVALGAAILAGVLQGDLKRIKLMDVTSHSLGVETVRGGVAPLLERNTPIPVATRKIFSTPKNNQTSVPINIIEGETAKAKLNNSLGIFQLTGIPRAPRGVPQIEVEFAIDANGILKVSATDVDSGKSQNIVITGGVGLDRNQIERMKITASANDQKNEIKQELLDLRNHAESVFHDIQKWLEYNSKLMPPRTVEQIINILKKLKKKINKGDKVGIRLMLKKLDEVVNPYREAA